MLPRVEATATVVTTTRLRTFGADGRFWLFRLKHNGFLSQSSASLPPNELYYVDNVKL